MPAMSKITTAATILAALVAQAAGHTYVEKFQAGGQTYDGYYQPSATPPQDPGNQSPAWWTSQGTGFQPVKGDKLSDPDIIAHMNAKPSPYTVDAPAGEDVTFTWKHDGTCGGDEVGWDCSHHGWTATYLAPCNGDCKNVDKTQLQFFKIHQSALMNYPSGTRYAEGDQPEGYTGFWGTDAIFYQNNNQQKVTIPKDIPSGNYVLRTEVMSIHNNGDVANRQFWPQAFNIAVTGGDDSASVPSGSVGTELYNGQDELLQWDLYWHDAGKTDDDAPGPVLAKVATSSKVRRAPLKERAHPRDFSA